MTTYYQTKLPCVVLKYRKGALQAIKITHVDLVVFEVVRHSFPLYERDIDPQLFIRKK